MQVSYYFFPLARQVCVYLAGLLLPLPYRPVPASPAGPQTDRTGWGGSGTGWRTPSSDRSRCSS